MIKNIFFQVFSLLYFASFGQQLELKKVGYVPDIAEECSGIALLPSGHIAMINDSGNEPEVFITDKKGKLIKSIYLPDACNIDWEEIEYANGHLYIGDFGNNKNERKDLVVLKYSINEEDSIFNQEIIKFSFANQRDFPPNKKAKNFDMEAMIHFGDSLYLFSKNRTKPFDGYTYLYGMPDQAGNYEVAPLDSFKTGIGEKDYWWVAGASISPDGKRLALLGYDKLWLFEDFKGSDFFNGKHTTISLGWLSQKESITFLNNSELLITDELNRFGGGKVYHTQLKEPKTLEVSVGPKEFSEEIQISLSELTSSKVHFEIFDTKGNRVLAGKIPEGQKQYSIDTKDFPAGGYVVNILMGSKPYQAFKLKKLYAKTDN